MEAITESSRDWVIIADHCPYTLRDTTMPSPLSARSEIPTALNLLLVALFVAIALAQYLLLPLLLSLSAWWLLAILPLALTTTTFWSLIHEAIHGMLHPQRAINVGLGRLLTILFGSPFRLLRFGHLMHHRHNRTRLDRTEVFDPAEQPRWRAAMAFYPRLLGGLYLSELAACLLVWLPRPMIESLAVRALGDSGAEEESSNDRLRGPLLRQLLSRDGLAELRLDALLILSLLAVTLWLYGPYWWALLLLLLLRGFLISFLDNSYHYGTPLDDIPFSYNLALPEWLSALILHFNKHHVHHLYPTLSWAGLARRFREEQGRYEGGMLSVAMRQLRGPIALPELAGEHRVS